MHFVSHKYSISTFNLRRYKPTQIEVLIFHQRCLTITFPPWERRGEGQTCMETNCLNYQQLLKSKITSDRNKELQNGANNVQMLPGTIAVFIFALCLHQSPHLTHLHQLPIETVSGNKASDSFHAIITLHHHYHSIHSIIRIKTK